MGYSKISHIIYSASILLQKHPLYISISLLVRSFMFHAFWCYKPNTLDIWNSTRLISLFFAKYPPFGKSEYPPFGKSKYPPFGKLIMYDVTSLWKRRIDESRTWKIYVRRGTDTSVKASSPRSRVISFDARSE